MILKNEEELMWVVVVVWGWGWFEVTGSLGCKDHEMVEFRILRGGRSVKSRSTALGFRIAVFSLYRDLLERISRNTTLERRGIWKSRSCKITSCKVRKGLY